MKRYQNRPILSDRKTQISGSHVRIGFYSLNYSFLCYYFGRNGFSDLEIMEIDKKFLKIAWKLIDLEDFLNRHQLKAVGSPKNTKNPLNRSILNRFFQWKWIQWPWNTGYRHKNFKNRLRIDQFRGFFVFFGLPTALNWCRFKKSSKSINFQAIFKIFLSILSISRLLNPFLPK